MKKIFTYIKLFILIVAAILCVSMKGYSQDGEWKIFTNGGIITRHECTMAEINGKFYLLGGRRLGIEKYTNIFDPATKTWTKGTHNPPMELHHFQAVPFNGLIYILGAFTGGHPSETSVSNVFIYNPNDDTWNMGDAIPQTRVRGAAGAVLYNNKIYVVGGATNGHIGGNVAWLDEYNPVTGEWKALSDAPRARDHFQAVVVGTKLYLAAGRRSKMILNTTSNKYEIHDEYFGEVDVYDFTSRQWETFPNNIPTVRAGTAAVHFNNDLIVIGGESTASGSLGHAHKEAQAMDLTTKQWRNLAQLDTGRHATHAVVFNNHIYIASGSKANGGSTSSQLSSMEEFSLSVQQQNSLSVPTELNLGQVTKEESKNKTITIINDLNNGNITINDILLNNNTENAYSIVSLPDFPHLLAPGTSITIEIKFNPSSLGVKNSELRIRHTGVNDPATVSLTGEGILKVTAIDKGELFKSVNIYPNPTKNYFTISAASSDYQWEIYTSQGVKINSGLVENNLVETVLDISGISQGMYLLILKSKNGDAVKSFIINKE